MRKQFTFYASFFEAVSELPDGEREAVYDAVCAFALKGERRELPGIAQRVAMKLIMPNLIASRTKALAAQGKSGDLNTNGKSKKKDKKEIENKKENEIKAEAEVEGQGESREAGAQERARLEREFDCFWREYPVKLGRESALQLWLEQRPNLDEMLAALGRWRVSPTWTEASGRYIPQARRFLSDGYCQQSPPEPERRTYYGASGQMGPEEREAIRRLMADDNPGSYYDPSNRMGEAEREAIRRAMMDDEPSTCCGDSSWMGPEEREAIRRMMMDD